MMGEFQHSEAIESLLLKNLVGKKVNLVGEKVTLVVEMVPELRNRVVMMGEFQYDETRESLLLKG